MGESAAAVCYLEQCAHFVEYRRIGPIQTNGRGEEDEEADAGCAGGCSGVTVRFRQAIKVGHVVYTMEHQFHQSIAKELQSYGQKMYGVKVIILDGGGKGEKMLAAVENLIAQKVDAISIHSPETALTAKAIELAHAKKIPIVTTLIYPDSKNAPHVQPMETPASYAEGKIAAQQWLKAFPDKPCKVALLNFGAWEQGEVLRFGPFFEGVKAVDPNAELVTVLNGQGSTEVSMKVTLDILQAHPETNIFFGGNDEMALGALAACEQRGKRENGQRKASYRNHRRR